MIRCDKITPFVVFITQHTFPGDKIRPGTADTCWHVCTMTINQQMIFGSFLYQPVVKIYHFLVVPVHKINLDT